MRSKKLLESLSALDDRLYSALERADEKRTRAAREQESPIDIEVELAGIFYDLLEQSGRDIRALIDLARSSKEEEDEQE